MDGNVVPVVDKFFKGSFWAFSEYMHQLEKEGFWRELNGKMQLTWKGIKWLRKLKVRKVPNASYMIKNTNYEKATPKETI